MTNKIVFSISFSLFLSASFNANAQSAAENKFPFLNGYYCDNAIDKNEPIFVINYPNIRYPLADYGCKIVKYRKTDKGYSVDQLCDVTENNSDANRNEHWELSSNKKVIYIHGTKLTRCKP